MTVNWFGGRFGAPTYSLTLVQFSFSHFVLDLNQKKIGARDEIAMLLCTMWLFIRYPASAWLQLSVQLCGTSVLVLHLRFE